MQLASMWSISWNIQHLAKQQSQHKIKSSMLRKRTCCHFRGAIVANWRNTPHNDVIKRTKAIAASGQKVYEHWDNCALDDLEWSIQRRQDEKRTFSAKTRKRNGFRIMEIERPLWEVSEFKMQRQRLRKTRKIWEMLKRRDRQPERRKKHSRSCWMLLETVWAILHVQTMRRMGKMRKTMKNIRRLSSSV